MVDSKFNFNYNLDMLAMVLTVFQLNLFFNGVFYV